MDNKTSEIQTHKLIAFKCPPICILEEKSSYFVVILQGPYRYGKMKTYLCSFELYWVLATNNDLRLEV